MRQFAQDEVSPHSLEYDSKPPDFVPWNLVQGAAKLGLLSFLIPEELGGGGLQELGAAVIVEELAVADAGFATIIGANALGQAPIFLSSEPEAWERFFAPAIESIDSGRPYIFAYAITEPDAGSDVEDDVGSGSARLSTFARKEGDEYILSGKKVFISNGNIADLVCVFAATDPKRGIESWTCFAVPTDSEGFHVARSLDKMGQRMSPTAELYFEDLRVPEENIVGGLGEGWTLNKQTLAASRGPTGAIAVGIARAAYERALEYAGTRRQGGRLLIEHQLVQEMLANMATEIEASRLLVWKACYLAENQLPIPLKESSMAKVFASDVAMKVTTDAVQIMGGYGYMREMGVEKLMRDAKLTQIYEGTNQINRLEIAYDLMKASGVWKG